MEIKKLIKEKKPENRFLSELFPVLYDKQWAQKAKNFVVYQMFRGLEKKNKIRYDITVIFPKMLGKEFPKTKGHFHKKGEEELYKILKGEAIFLFQKTKNKKVEDAFVVFAKQNHFVLIPHDYEHITINSGKKNLVLANWINEKTINDYSHLEKMEGACYYWTTKGWVENKNYKNIPALRIEKPLKEKPQNLKI